MTLAIVFPPPPPTTNTLTSRQRTQLLRKTKKLERVLGTAPRLIDTPYISEPRNIKSRSLSRCSDYSILSSTSSFSGSHSRQSSSASLLSTRSSRVSSKVLDDFYKMNLPVLRLTVQPSESLDTIPASPVSSTCSDDSDPRFILRPNADVAEPDYPSFTIPTNNTLRRQKLDRLRRKLGDGIPFDLVFPSPDDDESEDSKSTTSSPLTKDLPPLPRQSERKITSARDSLIVMTTSPSRPGYRIKRKPVPKIMASRPAPPPPSPSPSPPPYSPSSLGAKTLQTSNSIVKPRDQITKARLSLILESPDEHGNTVIEEMEVSLLSSKWRRSSSGYDFDASGWFEDNAV